MKKSLIVVSGLVAILIVVVGVLVLKRDNVGDVMDGPGMVNEPYYDMNQENGEGDNMGQGMVNEFSSYSVKTRERGEFPGEDIYVYDDNGDLVFSLEDNNQPQYLFALYENFIVLDSGTSASQRDMLVYDIKYGNKIFQTDYFPGENGLVLNDKEITFYKKIDDSLLGEYTLPECKSEYDNGYIENYGYTIGEDQANDLGDIQCAYFE